MACDHFLYNTSADLTSSFCTNTLLKIVNNSETSIRNTISILCKDHSSFTRIQQPAGLVNCMS